jgi:phenylpropionate dioxygenase-like ring-hydroxylating dioxygenase large terminal subunit
MNDLRHLDLSAARRPASEASCLPPECYVSEAVCKTEITQIFRRSWLCVGRADLVAQPGDVQALDMAGQSLILLRDQDGNLRCFANTCRHRAARLVDGNTNCKGIRCPFHSWFYGLDGRLVSAPKMEAATGFDRTDNGLISHRAEERFGFAFVCLDPETPPLDSQLAEFGEIHAPWPASL